jgi:nicotinate phosphoribosyltransferase
MKLSKGKITLPGKKQIFRQRDRKGKYVKDIVGLEDEKIKGEPLLAKVMENGKIVHDVPTLTEIRNATLENLSELPNKYKKLVRAPSYPVELSHALSKITNQLTSQLKNYECISYK